MNFITLKELKKMVPVASEFKRVPGLKKILEDGIEVILRKQMENHAEVVVYKNGYVSYHAHERYTVFALHNCTHYYYESQGNEHQTIPHNHFEDMEWHIRLVLEGEDRLVRNLEARESETYSYAADVNPEYNNEMEDPRINVMDFVLNKEFLRKASELLKKHQWEMICRHYIEGMTHREIAAEMGVSDEVEVEGHRFVQMRSEQTKNPPPSIILHESGAFVTQTALGFDGEATRKMCAFLQDPKPDLLHHQKFFENGTAERAKESGTEQNYNMIDGCVNNVPKKPRRIGGRWSVLDRLHIKQAERRQKDNAPQQEQERSRKS